MIALSTFSKINLGLNPAPGFWNVNSLGRLLVRRSVNRFVPDYHLYSNIRSWLHRGLPQIKARHFEIPACRGFLMTSMADDLPKFLEPNREVVIYSDLEDLRDKIGYYLTHEEERASIAQAGYERVMRDHTYDKRFREIFKAIGLSYE